MRHRPDYRPPWERKRRRAWAPGEGPPKPPSTLYPGSDVRILSSAPQWAFGPNAPPVYPGPPDPPTERSGPEPSSPPPLPAPDQTGLPGTPEPEIPTQTKEIVAPNWGEQEILKPIPAPQTEDGDNKRKDMIENPDFNAPDEIEEVPEADIELPLQVELLQREIEQRESEEGEREFSDGSKRRRRREEQDISLSHHAARCSICQHPDRDAIEQGFLHWESPTLLALEYGLGRRRAIYRHARALGLYEKRGARTRRNLEFVMEQAENTTATASDVIRAVRAYSCLTEDGRWTEPTKRLVVEHVDRPSEEGFGPSLASHSPAEGGRRATRHSSLVTESITLGDGHARPSKNAVTPAPSTKVRKLMDTLYRAFSASIGSRFGRRFS